MGERLGETLRLDERMTLTRVWRGSHRAVVETEEVLAKAMARYVSALPEAQECQCLDPEHFAPYIPRTRSLRPTGGFAEERLGDAIESWRAGAADGEALLLVGHQPMLSWVGERLLGPRARLTRRRLPVGRELVCLALGEGRFGRPRRWVAWSIEAMDDEERRQVAKALAEKLKAKIEIARWLAGVLVFGLTILLGALLDAGKLKALEARNPAAQELLLAAGALLLAALGLFLGTLFAYDRLSMPTRFWAESPPRRAGARRWLVRRPPSGASYVIYQNMIRVWRWLFLPAAAATVLGLGILGGVALNVDGWWWFAGVAIVVAICGWYGLFRPRLGSED